MNLKDRFPIITNICFSVKEKHLYVFTKEGSNTENLSIFLDNTYLLAYSILPEGSIISKGSSSVSLELNNYSGFCTYLYQLESQVLQFELLKSELNDLISKKKSEVITTLLRSLDITKLKDVSLTLAQLEEYLSFRVGMPKAHSLLGLN